MMFVPLKCIRMKPHQEVTLKISILSKKVSSLLDDIKAAVLFKIADICLKLPVGDYGDLCIQ